MKLPLFPPIEPYEESYLKVSDLHTLYFEQSGNPKGVPILFVHGGPGGATTPSARQFFDPDFYRIIVFHQRGCGKSRPLAEIRENTTPLLVEDMEKLRQHLGVERWHLFGGSWGSTLSLAYAQAHPHRCVSLILRGVFLCRKEEIDWFYERSNIIYPDYFAEYEAVVPSSARNNRVKAFHKLLNSENKETQLRAAQAWAVYEARCSTLYPNQEVVDHFLLPENAIPMARIENHYFMNNIFLKENQLLDECHKLKDIPISIVHGRYDMVCPLKNAFDLKAAAPHAVLSVIADGAHAPLEPSMVHQLVAYTEKAKALIV